MPPQQVVGVAQEEEEHTDGQPEVEAQVDEVTELVDGELLVVNDLPAGEEPLGEAGPPHDDAGAQGQPLVVGDDLVRAALHLGREQGPGT